MEGADIVYMKHSLKKFHLGDQKVMQWKICFALRLKQVQHLRVRPLAWKPYVDNFKKASNPLKPTSTPSEIRCKCSIEFFIHVENVVMNHNFSLQFGWNMHVHKSSVNLVLWEFRI